MRDDFKLLPHQHALVAAIRRAHKAGIWPHIPGSSPLSGDFLTRHVDGLRLRDISRAVPVVNPWFRVVMSDVNRDRFK